jgi:AcrR family transcriptional regulator
VTVQEVLDRASVGRSTFYLHFRDKNDLLLSQLENFLEIMSTTLTTRKEKSDRVVPVTEMFAHIGCQNKIYRALADSGRLTDFFDLAQGYFHRMVWKGLGYSLPCGPRVGYRANSQVRTSSIKIGESLPHHLGFVGSIERRAASGTPRKRLAIPSPMTTIRAPLASFA